MGRRILVTGGAGFIGSHLVEELLARGDVPIILDDLSSGSLANVPSQIEFVNTDIAHSQMIDIITDLQPSAIIHAAAQASVFRSMADPARDRCVNLVGSSHVVSAAQRLMTCRVIFLSTGGGIYGETEEPATERSMPRPKSFYSIHKYTAERYVELAGVPYAIARLANVYGPRQRSDLEGGVAAIFAERLSTRQDVTIHGSGEQCRDFVHVKDVVSALLTMLDSDQNGLWNVGTGKATTINQLLSRFEAQLGPASHVHHEPSRIGDVFASCLDVSQIVTDLGWRASVSLDEGIAKLLLPERELTA